MGYQNFKINNQTGSAMILALAAIIAISATAIYIMNSSKNKIDIETRIKINADVNRAMSIIGSILLSPANCNANFYNSPTQTGTLSSLKVCPENFNCRGDIAPTAYLQIGASSWNAAITGLSPRLRVKSMSYSIVGLMSPPYQPATLEIKIVFEERIGASVKTIIKNTETFVVTTATGISGCPSSPNTITLY